MKRMLMAACAAFALSLLGFSALGTAHADQVLNISYPVSGQVINACNGEVVDFSGNFHLLINETTTPSGGFHLDIHDNAQGITGTGETTGAKYSGSQADNFTLNINAGGAANVTANGQFKEVAQGSVPNFTVNYTQHITVNANGDVTATVDNFTTTCH